MATKNDVRTPEKFVQCIKCPRKFHEICVLQLTSKDYICCNCLKKKVASFGEKYSAEKLKRTDISDFIEKRINDHLKTFKSDIEPITIRNVLFCTKTSRILPETQKRMPSSLREFPYNSRAIFAFQKVDGSDVCFFGFYAQEYSNCDEPNNRRVYLAYMDSVCLMEPKSVRSSVYKQILMAYFEYMKKLGYVYVHIWACPPKPRVDYIFYRHPKEQKYLSRSRLTNWYKDVLEQCIEKGVIRNYYDILERNIAYSSILQIPYFDGDFWPDAIEYCLKTNPNISDSQIVSKIFGLIKTHKHSFLIIELNSCTNQKDVETTDTFLFSELFDVRMTFLTNAYKNHLEFSDIRRAKFSSLTILYSLHKSRFMYEKLSNGENEQTYTLSDLLDALMHANACRDSACQIFCCKKMKKVINHSSTCQTSECSTCDKYLQLCYHHAKYCQDNHCVISVCEALKLKVEEEKAIER